MAGAVSFLGFGSGQDYTTMISAMVNVRRMGHVQPLQVWESQWLTKLNSISNIDSALSSFYSTVQGMDRVSEFVTRSCSSSDESVFSATATSAAVLGAHSIIVNQLARSETEVHHGIQNSIKYHSGVTDQTESINNSGDAATGIMGETFTITAIEGAAGNITLNLADDPGATYTSEVTDITCLDKSELEQGNYFIISSAEADYYVWYDLDGTSSDDPALEGYTGIRVDISGDTTAAEVAASTAAAIDLVDDFGAPVPGGATLTVTNTGGGYVTDAADSSGSASTGFTVGVTVQGTDQVRISYAAGVMTVGILDGSTTQQEISDAIAGHELIDTVVPDAPESAWTLGGNGGADDTVTLAEGADGETKTFKYTYNGSTRIIDLAYHGTLVDLKDAINADAGNPGVTAKIITSGGQDHLSLVEDTPDGAKSILIDPDSDMTLDGTDGTVSFTVDAHTEVINASGSDKIFQLQFSDNAAVDITVPTGTTLEGLRDLINNTGVGIQAWILNDGGEGSDAQHLVLSGENTGDDYTIILNSGGTTTLDGANDTEDFTNGAGVFEETSSAQNSQIRVDGYPSSSWIERTDNQISDVIEGVSLSLIDTGTVTVTVSSDNDAIIEKVEEFREAFNSVRASILSATGYNEDTSSAGSLLGNYAVQLVKSRLDNIVSGAVPGFQESDDTYINLQQLGFYTDVEEGSETEGLLLLDTSRLSDALADDPDLVAQFFSACFDGATNDSQISFYSSLDTATPGIYDVEVNTDILKGRFQLEDGDWSDWYNLSGSSGDYYLTGTSGPERGIALHITYASGTGTHSTELSLKNGVATELARELENLVSASGPLNTLENNYNDIIDNIEDKIADEERRLVKYEEMLTERFVRLDTYMNRMTQIGSSFASMLGTMSTNS